MSILEIKNISKKYGHHRILNQLSISGNSGDCIGIVGANGCGKSTFLKIISGDLKPDSGSIIFNDGQTGYVPQENPLFETLTVKDNLKLAYCDSQRSLKEDSKNGLIHDLGIDKYLHYKVSQLSGGTKKKISIICALIHGANILLLDEPGASLDIVAKNDIQNIMKNFISEGGLILIASHEAAELSLCNKLYLLKDGSLKAIKPDTSLQELADRLVDEND